MHRARRRLRPGPGLPVGGRPRRRRAGRAGRRPVRRARRQGDGAGRDGAQVVAADVRASPRRPGGGQRRAASARRVSVVVGRRHGAAAPGRARSTGCWSTPRARASARCAAGPTPAGASRPTPSTASPPCSASCWRRPRRWSAPAGRSSTPCAPSPPPRAPSVAADPGLAGARRRRRRAVAAVGERRPAAAPDGGHRRHVPRSAGRDRQTRRACAAGQGAHRVRRRRRRHPRRPLGRRRWPSVLEGAGFDVVEQRVVADGVEPVRRRPGRA